MVPCTRMTALIAAQNIAKSRRSKSRRYSPSEAPTMTDITTQTEIAITDTSIATPVVVIEVVDGEVLPV